LALEFGRWIMPESSWLGWKSEEDIFFFLLFDKINKYRENEETNIYNILFLEKKKKKKKLSAVSFFFKDLF